MELILNLVGVLVAVAMVCLWLRWGPREGFDRRTQLVGLALLILILFPVISVTDDLLAAQNPAETDSLVRRDHLVSTAGSAFPALAAMPTILIAEQPSRHLRPTPPGTLQAPLIASPAMAPIENRPPPAA